MKYQELPYEDRLRLAKHLGDKIIDLCKVFCNDMKLKAPGPIEDALILTLISLLRVGHPPITNRIEAKEMFDSIRYYARAKATGIVSRPRHTNQAGEGIDD